MLVHYTIPNPNYLQYHRCMQKIRRLWVPIWNCLVILVSKYLQRLVQELVCRYRPGNHKYRENQCTLIRERLIPQMSICLMGTNMTQEGMLYFSYDHKLTNCGRLMLWVCRCRASVETMVSMNSPLLYFTDPCLRIKLWIYLCGCSTNRFQTRGSKCKQRRFSDFVCGAFICFGEVVKCFSFTEKYI